MKERLFKGTGRLIKLLFRQNRLKIILWIACLVGITIATASAYGSVYKTAEDIYGYAVTMSNPAMKAMLGPGYEMEHYSIGTILASEMLLFTTVAVAVMNILLVSSGTRNDEEEGRLEMVLSLPTGRLAYLAATGILIIAVNLLLVLLIGIGLASIGEESFTWESSFLYGAVLGAAGLFFAGLTALFAQLSNTSRGTVGLSIGLLIAAYILRAIGDVEIEPISLFSPLGWAVRTEVFAGNKWWPVFALLAGGTVLTAASLYFNVNRDIYAGILPARKGRAYALGYLKTPLGLIWRLERINLISWALGIFLLSAAFGAVLKDLENYFSDMEFLRAFFTDNGKISMTDQFINLLFRIMSIFSAVPAVSTVLKLRKMESLGYAENIYSRAVSRNQMLGSTCVISFLAAAVMQACIGLGLYLSSQSLANQSLELGNTLSSALVYMPALMVVIGLAVLLVGLWPRSAGFIWLYVVFTFSVVYLSKLLHFPEWLNGLSPFHHIPQLPHDEINWWMLSGLSLLAVLLSLIGFVGYNKRDIQSG